jgi:hypothetical protein
MNCGRSELSGRRICIYLRMSVIAWTGNQKRTKETRVISHMNKIKLPASELSPVRILQTDNLKGVQVDGCQTAAMILGMPNRHFEQLGRRMLRS